MDGSASVALHMFTYTTHDVHLRAYPNCQLSLQCAALKLEDETWGNSK